MSNVLSKELIENTCFQCGIHITKSDLIDGDIDLYMKILEKMENDSYTLCEKCAYKLCWMYYMNKFMSAMSKFQHYIGKHENV